MKHLLLMTTLLAGFATLCQAKRTTAVYQVTPQPRTMGTVKANPYQLTSSTAIIVKDAALNNEAGFLRQYVKEQTGITLADKGKGITLKLNKKIKGKEDYTLKVRANGVTILHTCRYLLWRAVPPQVTSHRTVRHRQHPCR